MARVGLNQRGSTSAKAKRQIRVLQCIARLSSDAAPDLSAYLNGQDRLAVRVKKHGL